MSFPKWVLFKGAQTQQQKYRKIKLQNSERTLVPYKAHIYRVAVKSIRYAPLQVIQAGLGDKALLSVTSSCHNYQLSTQRVMGVRGKAASRQARPRGHALPTSSRRVEKKKLSCLSISHGACVEPSVLLLDAFCAVSEQHLFGDTGTFPFSPSLSLFDPALGRRCHVL